MTAVNFMSSEIMMSESWFLAAVARDWEDPAALAFRFAGILALVILNGFFVAAEYALTKVPRTTLDALSEEGKSSARLARRITQSLDSYLSACQLGITIASIALGWIGQPLVARLLQPLLAMLNLGDGVILGISLVVAFGILVFLHVVIGELIPKLVAMHSEVRTATFVARPVRGFYLLFCWPIKILNATADGLAKTLLRIDVLADREKVHSGEELRVLVEQTEQGEDVTETERKILINALELNDLTVRDIMTPRTDVVTLDVEKSFEENLQIAVDSKHTRFPLVSGHLDKTLGLIHIKDVVALTGENSPSLMAICRDIITVPDLMPLDVLLKTFLAKHAHFALVKDDFGGSLGLVMLDDVLEELVGEIQDEFDEEDKGFRRVSESEFVVQGSLPLHDLNAETSIVAETSDVSTVGGYITHLLGHLPEIGESVVVGNYEATVLLSDGRSVQEVRFKGIENPDLDDDSRADTATDTSDSKSSEAGSGEPVAMEG
jgi:CBS domain containing-hemolysin-like protein